VETATDTPGAFNDKEFNADDAVGAFKARAFNAEVAVIVDDEVETDLETAFPRPPSVDVPERMFVDKSGRLNVVEPSPEP
jgi:hypothetical protein